MFIGHIPASYLLTRRLLRSTGPALQRRLLWLGLAAGIAPDLDLLWFFLVDQRRHVHHSYLTHIPGAWILALLTAAAVLSIRHASRSAWLALCVIGANGLLHLVLDSVAGGIRWLWPWTGREFALAHVAGNRTPWFMNFVLHWTFGIELVLVAAALLVWLRSRTPAEDLVRG